MSQQDIQQMPGGIGNYKGVMLCSRPNEINQIEKERPFISRVDPKDPLGTNPVRKVYSKSLNKISKNVLHRHKNWLEEFKERANLKKDLDTLKNSEENEKFQKVRDMAARDREKTKNMKKEYEEMKGAILSELMPSIKDPKKAAKKLTAQNLEKLEKQATEENFYEPHVQEESPVRENEENVAAAQNSAAEPQLQKSSLKKKSKTEPNKQEKPAWARTEKDQEEFEEQECNELLDFMENLNFDKYINDLEVQALLNSLKEKIETMKKEDNWQNKVEKQIKEKKRANKEAEQLDTKTELDSQNQQFENRSVGSHKTHQSIQELKKDMEKKNPDWDKSVSDKKTGVSTEEKIAKHVADEILRDYRNMRNHHSNASIRALLEKEAKRFLGNEKGIEGPRITLVKEQEKFPKSIDPSNLPYLHRNPAI